MSQLFAPSVPYHIGAGRGPLLPRSPASPAAEDTAANLSFDTDQTSFGKQDPLPKYMLSPTHLPELGLQSIRIDTQLGLVLLSAGTRLLESLLHCVVDLSEYYEELELAVALLHP